MARPVAGSFRKARAASLAAVFRRKYAMMSYTDAFVAGDYAAEPSVTIKAIMREGLGSQGKRYSHDLRNEYKLIPGVVTRQAPEKPMLIEVDPRIIHNLMKGPNTRFLGRRYFLDIEGLERYEVIPQNVDVEPVGYYPLAVTFTLWHAKAVPKPKLPPHVHRKFFEALSEYPSLEEQQKQKEEGTYIYKRFMANTIQKQKGTPLKPQPSSEAPKQ
jgi:hypothetical protein